MLAHRHIFPHSHNLRDVHRQKLLPKIKMVGLAPEALKPGQFLQKVSGFSNGIYIYIIGAYHYHVYFNIGIEIFFKKKKCLHVNVFLR